MRKFFIALFLIFFAHCECVLGGAPSQDGSDGTVESDGEVFDADKCKEESGYYVNNGNCDICPVGYYCPAGQPDRVQCPSETPVSGTGSDDISDCRAITCCADVASVAGCGGSDDNVARKTACRNMAGCYWNEAEKICADCPVGSYCTNCRANAEDCPAGTTSEARAKQKSDCYLVNNELKQNGTEIQITIPYDGRLYFYTTVPETCPILSVMCSTLGGGAVM